MASGIRKNNYSELSHNQTNIMLPSIDKVVTTGKGFILEYSRNEEISIEPRISLAFGDWLTEYTELLVC